jgi:hypothetical protein
MKRFEDWPTRLDKFLLSRKSEPFVWGKNDCCLFAADAILAMTGEDFAARFRGTYDDLKGAVKILHDLGKSPESISELAGEFARLHEIQEVPVAYAQRGDVVLLDAELGESLGVVALDGVSVAAPGAENSLVYAPIGIARKAWRI